MERPKTRGELLTKLKMGISCEVAEYVAEMTALILRGWFYFSSFDIKKSENQGWVIFEPNGITTHLSSKNYPHE